MGEDDRVVLAELMAGDCLPSTLSKRTGLLEVDVEAVVASSWRVAGRISLHRREILPVSS